ncbi:related to Probable ribokinase [Hanseniaspora guilliermondii]|uniref:Ribokinase n=1 Tax=Hanseniaspora guilliermondii TaxID=56406 RepID=A0A1L0CVZ7_9ASCO|nr:related to Probable ribokinase [Hanseniaspora guilliermondii]
MSNTLITIVGSLNYDITTYLKKIPSANETSISDNVEYNLGGKGFNQCISVSKSLDNSNEVNVRMLGSVGSDIFGTFFLEELQRRNVDIDSIKIVDNENTGVANIIVESENNHSNRIMVFSGANKNTVFDDNDLVTIFKNPFNEFVVLQNEIPDPLKVVKYIQSSKKNKFIVYNPSPFNAIDYPIDFEWHNIDLIIVNEIEAFQLAVHLNVVGNETPPTDESSTFVEYFMELTNKISNTFLSTNKNRALIVTLGSKGLIYKNLMSQKTTHMNASHLYNPPIDSTGCGDTFLGYFTSNVAKSLNNLDFDTSVLESLKIANIAAGIAATRKGASSSVPTRQEVRDLYKI